MEPTNLVGFDKVKLQVKKKNVYLFQPNFKIGEGKFSNYWLPYSIGALWANAASHREITDNYQLGGLFFRRDRLPDLLSNIQEPAVLGFSCYVWNWKYNIHTARELKKVFPDVLIIFGGPQVPENTDSFFDEHPFVDVACIAEGEITFYNILRRIIYGNSDFQDISGCLVKTKEGGTKETEKRERVDLSKLPNPYLAGVFDELIQNNPGISWNTTIETTRGCPFACTFCDWGSLIYSKVKKFPEKKVIDELEWISQNKIDYVFAADPNFGIYPDRDGRIVEKLIEYNNINGYPKTVNFQWYKNSNKDIVSLAKLLTDAKLNRALTLSAQSLNPSVLSAIKRKNIAFSKFGELLSLCDAQGVPTYTELILGLPEETYATWKYGLNHLLEIGQHNTIEVWLCEMIENAELNNRLSRDTYGLETRIVQNHFEQSKDESLEIPEEIEIVYATKGMPHNDLIKSYMYTWIIINIHIYGWTQIYSRFLRKYSGVSYEEFYGNLLRFIEQRQGSLLNNEYRDCEDLIRNYFDSGIEHRYCKYSGILLNGKTALWKSQFNFHHNHKEVTEELFEYFLSYDLDESIQDEISRFQKEYVTSFNMKYPYRSKYAYDFHEYISQSKAQLEKGSYFYSFDLTESYEDIEDYTLMLYFRRRQGWGKAKVSAVFGDSE